MPLKGNKKLIRAWAVYDWANSVYSLVITSAVFPVYYSAVTSSGGSEMVSFLGMNLINTALYSYAISFSFLVIALLSPLLSGIADYSGRKKDFMRFFCYLGAASCIGLYFFDAEHLYAGIICSVLASIGFAGSLVFYNAYLPEIARKSEQDAVSAKGFSYGYIGSSLLLAFSLTMILYPGFYGISDESSAPRISFILVGLWWAGFAQYSFYHLPHGAEARKVHRQVLLNGYREIRKVWIQLRHEVNIKRFLIAFFFYNMAVQTTMYIATLFGSKELGLKSEQLILTVFIIQFVGIGGAYLFSYLSSRFGNIRGLSIAIVIWIGICISAYFILTAIQFYILAFFVGMVMGGIQSLSRSTYSKLLPHTRDHASYFSFYDVTEKMSIVLGTFFYGYIEVLTGSMRFSVLFFILLFLTGLILLARIKKNAVIMPYFHES